MSFLIDTDVCSAYMKADRSVWQKFMQHTGRLHVSTITLGELFTWAMRANAPAKRSQALLDLMGDVNVRDVTADVARRFGEIRASLLDSGRSTPNLDLLIAATALVGDLTPVTHNVTDFTHIPGLKVDDWVSP